MLGLGSDKGIHWQTVTPKNAKQNLIKFISISSPYGRMALPGCIIVPLTLELYNQ